MEPRVIDTLTKEISTFPSVEKIILYGSRARGDNNPRSDIDLAVVCPFATEGEWSKIRRLADVEDNTVRTLLKIDIVQLKKAGKSLRESILREGKTLYEQ